MSHGGGKQDNENDYYWDQTRYFRVRLMSKVDGVGGDGHDIEVDGIKTDDVEWSNVAAGVSSRQADFKTTFF